MSLLGLDLNATRVRAVRGPLGDYPTVAMLEPPRAELPLVLSLEGRTPALGSAGLRLCRRAPQLAWQNFLPRLGEAAAPGRHWLDGRRRIDPDMAMTQVCQHLARLCKGIQGATLAVPAYLSDEQVARLLTLADQAGLPVLGSIAAPLAAALAAHAEQSWFGSCVVLDIDDQALTLTSVAAAEGQAQILDSHTLPGLGLRVWQERLLNALADGYILDSRWDPRESPAAEQALFDQLDEILDAAQAGRITKVTAQAGQRYQNLLLHSHDPAAFCNALRRQTLAEVYALFAGPWPSGVPGVVLVTAAAARLPGLVAALQISMPQWTPAALPPGKASYTGLEDFGNGLLDENVAEPGAVVVLAEDATARGAHSIGSYFQRGDIASGHLNLAAPLPLPQPLEAGPARLHFQGREYLLGAGSFTIGRQPGVDLVFDAEMWPSVAARHCEIVYDHRTHMLCDRSHRCTLVNDRPATQAVPLRPGDWIRLGPDGPLLRFLGQSVDLRPTA